MSKKSANKLIVDLKVSPALTAALSVLHLGALALLLPIDIAVGWRILLAVLLLASLYRNLARHAWRYGTGAIRALRWDDAEGLSLQRSKMQIWDSATVNSRFVHRWLVLLSVTPAGKRFSISVVIAADAIDADGFRRLRAALLAPPRMQEG